MFGLQLVSGIRTGKFKKVFLQLFCVHSQKIDRLMLRVRAESFALSSNEALVAQRICLQSRVCGFVTFHR